MRVRSKKHQEIAYPRKVVVELRSEERPGGIGGAVKVPVPLRPEQEPLAVRAEVHVRRSVDLKPGILGADERAAVVEIDVVHGERALETGSGIVRRHGHHVVRRDLEQTGRSFKRPAASQCDRRPGVGGGSPRQVRGRGGDQQRIRVQPRDVPFRRRQVKTAAGRVNKRAGPDVELAVAVRVTAVGGEGKQRETVRFAGGGAQERGAVEYPLHTVGGGEGIHIQQDIPVGGVRQVAFPRRPAPQPLRVRLVLPEVVVPLAALAHHGDPVRGVQHLQDASLQGRVVGVLQEVLGARVLLPDPGQRRLAVDFLQPDVLISGFGGGR